MGPTRPLTVIVVWTGYRPGPWVLRALRAAGHHPIGVSPDRSGGRSTACLRPHRIPSAATSPGGFMAGLEHLCREHGADAVLPLSENAVEVLAERGEGGVGGAVVVGPDARRYRALCDKTELGVTVAAAGLESPAGVTVGREGPSGPWPRLPSIVKLRATAMGESAIEVLVVRDERERAAAVEAILSAGHEAVVQERVVGTHWTVHAVRGAEGGFSAVLGRIERTFPRSAGMPSVIRVLAREGPAVEAARRLLDHVDHRGLANVQLFERHGRFVVHDVNLRPPATVALSIAAGLNLPALAIEAVFGWPWAPPVGPLVPFTYISRFDELKGLLDDTRESGAKTALRHGSWRRQRGRRRLIDPPLRDPLWLARLPRGAARRVRSHHATRGR